MLWRSCSRCVERGRSRALSLSSAMPYDDADDILDDLLNGLAYIDTMRRIRCLKCRELTREHAGFHIVLRTRLNALLDQLRIA